jgi:hypothetical protein
LKKNILISLGVLLLVILASWFFYSKFIKYTIQEVQKSIFKEYDTIEKFTKIPQPILSKDCEFDLDAQTDDFLKTIPEFSVYSWDNNTKKATIDLDSENFLLVERGGCKQFRFYATLHSKKSDLKVTDQQAIFKEALWIGSKLFEIEDYMFFQNALATGAYEIYKYENELLITFDSEKFCNAEIYFKSNPKIHSIELKIGYTLCGN